MCEPIHLFAQADIVLSSPSSSRIVEPLLLETVLEEGDVHSTLPCGDLLLELQKSPAPPDEEMPPKMPPQSLPPRDDHLLLDMPPH